MPRDNDKNNSPSRGRRGPPGAGGKRGGTGDKTGRDRSFGGKRPSFGGAGDKAGPRSEGRSFSGGRDKRPEGAERRSRDGDRPRKFGDRKFGDRKDGDRSAGARSERPFTAKRFDGDAPRKRFSRDDGARREDRAPRDSERPRARAEGHTHRDTDRPRQNRDDRPRQNRDDRPRDRSTHRDDRGKTRGPQHERINREEHGKRAGFVRGKLPERDGNPAAKRWTKPSSSERPQSSKPWVKRDAPSRGGDRDRGGDRARTGASKPWVKRDDSPRRDEADRPRFARQSDARPERTPERDRAPRKFDRPRQPRGDWKDHPRSEAKPHRESEAKPYRERETATKPRRENERRPPDRTDRFSERPRRDNENDSRVFAKRPAFGGRGTYRDRDAGPPPREPRAKKPGERIAKLISRAGLCSRRDAEDWVTQGRVAVNGRVVNSPALDVTTRDVVTVDGKPLPERERTRLFLYHKPRGLMTTHADPEGRPTVFENLPPDLPRLISIGRLDFNTEGLLLLTNDGGLARVLELPDTGWLRRYRVRAHGEVTQAQLDVLANGVEVDGVKYGAIDAKLERDQGANVWLVFAIREGKNREVRNVLAHLGLEVNRLIRISYGPFQLGELAEGAVEEVRSRVLRDQLGETIARQAGAEFAKQARDEPATADTAPPARSKVGRPRKDKNFKPSGKNALIADSKGRRVLVQRAGSAEARERNELEANGYGPPRRPKRGYHGKRDLAPKDE